MKFAVTLFFSLLSICLFGQFKETPSSYEERTPIDKEKHYIHSLRQVNHAPSPMPSSTLWANYSSKPLFKAGNLSIHISPTTGRILWIQGKPQGFKAENEKLITQAFNYLEAVKSQIQIQNPQAEFVLQSQHTDQMGEHHLRFSQWYKGFQIEGSEVILHTKEQVIASLNGRFYPTPVDLNLEMRISEAQALSKAKDFLSNQTTFTEWNDKNLKFIAGEPEKITPIIYHLEDNSNRATLAYEVEIIPNVSHRWKFIIDANSGKILSQFNHICQLHGWHSEHHTACAHSAETPHESAPLLSEKEEKNIFFSETTATARDLDNVNRTVNVWRDGNTYIMIDASRPMYNAALSDLPNEAVGVIGTFDGNNTYPGQEQEINIINHQGNTSWSRNEISAHYNAGIAYEYFRTTFGRNSIKNQGENIFSVINVAEEDGSDMDNAFWNGEIMFYGNGNQAFTAPLAKALDVAGHEMAHGVVQSTANLTYQGESGALNESFADIFGAMIDRDDWQIGESISNPAIFPSGTMRDMSNPNNGGNAGNHYWQPAHYSEKYTGSEDNGGVHINSGIPNYAYYKFATSSGIGKFKAEQVFYKALNDYLVMSSQFIDLRLAVVQAASDLHGDNSSEVQAAKDAFDEVGIFNGSGGDYEVDVQANPGDEFILWSDHNLSTINTSTDELENVGAFSSDNHISRPSINDDGTVMTYVASDGSLKMIELDWQSGSPQILEEYTLSATGSVWRNIAVSKDGTKVAALAGNLSQNEYDNSILIYDFVSGEGLWYELNNPTSADGIRTGEVLYADAIEWDITGEYLLYDAYNQIVSSFGDDIEYWDIGVLKVWDNGSNNFANNVNPQINKIFNNLGDKVSVGNPTFAKNSPYIIAFDHLELNASGTVDYTIYGVNIQTGDQGVIFETNTPGYPSYSKDDTEILFSYDNQGTAILAIRGLASNKVSGTGDAFVLIENSYWGSFYAIGERDIVNSNFEASSEKQDYIVFPNPTAAGATLQYQGITSKELNIEIYNAMGQLLDSWKQEIYAGENTPLQQMRAYKAGIYFIEIVSEGTKTVKKVIKQ